MLPETSVTVPALVVRLPPRLIAPDALMLILAVPTLTTAAVVKLPAETPPLKPWTVKSPLLVVIKALTVTAPPA